MKNTSLTVAISTCNKIAARRTKLALFCAIGGVTAYFSRSVDSETLQEQILGWISPKNLDLFDELVSHAKTYEENKDGYVALQVAHVKRKFGFPKDSAETKAFDKAMKEVPSAVINRITSVAKSMVELSPKAFKTVDALSADEIENTIGDIEEKVPA